MVGSLAAAWPHATFLSSSAAPCCPTRPSAGEWGKLSDFRRLLILRALKPDRVPAALGALCERALGARYTTQEPFSAKALLAESSPGTPIFFVLYSGYAPSAQIEAYARTGGRAVGEGCSARETLKLMYAGVHVHAEERLQLSIRLPSCRAVGKTAENGRFSLVSLGQGLCSCFLVHGGMGWLVPLPSLACTATSFARLAACTSLQARRAPLSGCWTSTLRRAAGSSSVGGGQLVWAAWCIGSTAGGGRAADATPWSS